MWSGWRRQFSALSSSQMTNYGNGHCRDDKINPIIFEDNRVHPIIYIDANEDK